MSSRKQETSVKRTVALCYVRQSFTRNENDMNSPERQRANIADFCARKGWTPEWYEDVEGHKSGRRVDNRPGWLALSKRIGDPDVVAVVANDLARFHRKTWRMGQLVDLLDEYGIFLALADPQRSIDTSTSQGRMFLTLLAMQDEAYANDISERVKSSIAYRKAQGKTVGAPPFGTIRNEEGYLIPSPQGAWLMSNGQFRAGHKNEDPPEDGALWRGYYDCAERILSLYAENKRGLERLAYHMNSEGWAFRDRKGNPRPITRDDVRRVVSSWREYAGLITEGRGKDKNMSLMDDPVGTLHDTGRAVFPLDLLRQVALVQQKRSATTKPHGASRKTRIYPLAGLLTCAQCERNAIEHNDLRLRSTLSGWNARGVYRYRHVQGVKCGCKARTVRAESVEADFRRLISLLTISPEGLAQMTELAMQAEWNMDDQDAIELERQKKAAIAKQKRRLDAIRHLYADGEMTREEYLINKEDAERQIAHWEARTTATEQATLELRLCMEALERITSLWDAGSDQEKLQLAQMLFDDVVYDLDARRIVDFRLKPWADRYLTLRAAMYEAANVLDLEEEKCYAENLQRSTISCPIGDSNPCFGLERATS
ncbi:MAG: hypothetical protein Kow0077_28820 [Anaerolineae bacterium]